MNLLTFLFGLGTGFVLGCVYRNWILFLVLIIILWLTQDWGQWKERFRVVSGMGGLSLK